MWILDAMIHTLDESDRSTGREAGLASATPPARVLVLGRPAGRVAPPRTTTAPERRAPGPSSRARSADRYANASTGGHAHTRLRSP